MDQFTKVFKLKFLENIQGHVCVVCHHGNLRLDRMQIWPV